MARGSIWTHVEQLQQHCLSCHEVSKRWLPVKQPATKSRLGSFSQARGKQLIFIQRKRTNDAASRADLLQESVSVNIIMCHTFLPKVYVAIKRKKNGKKNSTRAMCTRRTFFFENHFLKRSHTDDVASKNVSVWVEPLKPLQCLCQFLLYVAM